MRYSDLKPGDYFQFDWDARYYTGWYYQMPKRTSESETSTHPLFNVIALISYDPMDRDYTIPTVYLVEKDWMERQILKPYVPKT